MTLDALIDMNPDLSMTERIKIMRSLAEALHELHSKGWLHNRKSITSRF
jgi:serine/threonine protein kinase